MKLRHPSPTRAEISSLVRGLAALAKESGRDPATVADEGRSFACDLVAKYVSGNHGILLVAIDASRRIRRIRIRGGDRHVHG